MTSAQRKRPQHAPKAVGPRENGGHSSAARRRDYETYIASPAWEAKRQRALRKQGNACRACGSPGPALHVHHHTYDRFRNEHDSDLVVLCKPCHETIHRIHKRQTRKNPAATLTEVTFAFLHAANPGPARKPTPAIRVPPAAPRTDGKRVVSLNRADRGPRPDTKGLTKAAMKARTERTRAIRRAGK